MSVRQSAFAAIRWTTSAMIGRALCSLIQISLLARILSLEDFRLAAITMTFVNISSIFADMGISNSIIRFKDISADEFSCLFFLNLALGAALTLCVMSMSPLVGFFYGDQRITMLLLYSSCIFFIAALGQQQKAVAEKELRFKTLFRIEIIASVSGLCVAIGTALAGLGAASIIFGAIVNAVVASGLLWTLRDNGMRLRLYFNFALAKRFISFGSDTVIYSLLNAATMNADILIGGKFLPGATLGYYVQPRDLCLRLMFIVNPIVTRVSFPLIAAISHDTKRIRSVYLQAVNMTASINFPAYAFLALFSSDVVEIVLGPRWSASAPIMRALAIFYAVRSIGNPTGGLLLATGFQRRAMYSSGLVTVVTAVLVWIGAAYYGVLGIPTCLGLFYAALVPLFWAFLVRPACQARFVEYHIALLKPLSATFVASCGALLASHATHSLSSRLSASSLVFATVYGIVSFALNRKWVDAMIELLVPRRAVVQ